MKREGRDKSRFSLREFYLVICLLLFLVYPASGVQNYPEWKIKLSYTLLAKGKEIQLQNPQLAQGYYKRAYEIYPLNQEAKELAQNIRLLKKADSRKRIGKKESLPVEKERTIIAQYQGISDREIYPAWKRGPTINTVLDIYHPEHPGKKIPYYKDYEGFKINEALGVWANYEIEKSPVGMETLIENAKEFARYSDEQLREYVSCNEKEFWDWELRYFYKDYWPKFIYRYHTSDTRREFPGKLVWSDNSLYSENEDYHELKLDYTWRALKYLGFLRIEPSYRYGRWTSDNDPYFTAKERWWHLTLTSMPWDDIELKLEYTDSKKRKIYHPNIGGEILDAVQKREYFMELTKFVPQKRLKFVLSYLYRPEWWVPTDEEWNKQEVKFFWEKYLSSRLKFRQDFGYLYLERNKQPHLPSHLHNTAQWLSIKNKITREVIKDLTVSAEYEYGSGVDFSGFDYHNLDTEIELFKPGLIRLKLGTGYTYYYQIDDHVWSLYFKFSETAPFMPVFLFGSKWGNNELKLGLGYQYIDYSAKYSTLNQKDSYESWNTIFTLLEEARWGKFFLGTKLTLPIKLQLDNLTAETAGVISNSLNTQYDWKRIDFYSGWSFSELLKPYSGIRWSKEKLHWSDIETSGARLGVPGTDTSKAWLLLTGIKGNKILNDRLSFSYNVEYLPSLNTERFSDSSITSNIKFDPRVYMWEVGLKLEYKFINNSALFLDTRYGRITWDGQIKDGSEWPEEKIKYLELILGLKWLF